MKNVIIFGSVLLFANPTMAKSTTEQVEQLKTNAANSEANFKAYSENEETAKHNIEEAAKAIKDLDVQKAQLLKNVENIETNKAALDKMKQKVLGLQTKEREAAKLDEARILELKDTLTKLESSKKQHEVNASTYDQKLAEMEQEKKDWDKQRSAVGDLTKAIDTKKQEAVAAKATWETKHKTYSEQSKRWKAESTKSATQLRDVATLQ